MFPSLLPALAMLQAAATVTVQVWVPAAGPVGLSPGAWSAPVALGAPWTVDVPTGTAAQVQIQGGEIVTADLTVFCRSAVAPADPAAGGRSPRLYYQGRRYRVLGKRDIAGLPVGPGTVALVCALDNGGET